MKVDTSGVTGNTVLNLPQATDRLDTVRKETENNAKDPDVSGKAQVPPAEFLKQVKALTEDGQYSVRFEKDDSLKELIVKLVDRKTDKVIRQIPPEELLNLKKTLRDLSGNIVDTKS